MPSQRIVTREPILATWNQFATAVVLRWAIENGMNTYSYSKIAERADVKSSLLGGYNYWLDYYNTIRRESNRLIRGKSSRLVLKARDGRQKSEWKIPKLFGDLEFIAGQEYNLTELVQKHAWLATESTDQSIFRSAVATIRSQNTSRAHQLITGQLLLRLGRERGDVSLDTITAWLDEITEASLEIRVLLQTIDLEGQE
jgi:hypothetical protein